MSYGKCEKCGTNREMYYTPRCPKCHFPQIRVVKTLNLIECLTYLENNGHPGIYDRVWDQLVDYGYIHNDTSFGYHFPDDEEDTLYSEMKAIKETWGIEEDTINFEVSW